MGSKVLVRGRNGVFILEIVVQGVILCIRRSRHIIYSRIVKNRGTADTDFTPFALCDWIN